MGNKNLLRIAVEARKKYLIRMLELNGVTSDPGYLSELTLSELEDEWKRYQSENNKDIG